MRAGLALLVAFLLCGCATTVNLPPAPPGPAQKSYKEDYYQVKITAHDGKKLAATVYQPKLAPGETAPLIIATHGFGGFRAERPFSIYGKTMITGEAALDAWHHGYWVVFYDQRGWGDSQGVVHLMDPNYEVKDVSDVIDWSLKHIPAIHKLSDGSPAIGMIGESYGGDAQILASFKDPRLKALVPIASGYDFNALDPNGHMKTAWGANLLMMGAIDSGFDIGFMVKKPLRSGFTGTLSKDGQYLLYKRSPAYYCDQGETPKADALFVQGFRDTIFDMQQALQSEACFDKGGNDTRLLAIQGGHILPWPVQKWSGKPLFNTDDDVHCSGDGKATPTKDMIVDWWNEKLKGDKRIVPDVCVSLNYDKGEVLNQFPDSTQKFMLPDSWVSLPLAGMFQWFMVPFHVGGDLVRKMFWSGADMRFKQPQGGFGQPKFVPLYIAHKGERLLGIPKIDLHVDAITSKVTPVPFVGIGVQAAGMHRVHVASEHLTPLPGKGHYKQELPAVSRQLHSGDRVGLVIYGYTWQYFINPSLWYNKARVRGEVDLPILPPFGDDK